MAAIVGKAEKTWIGYHRNDSSFDLHRRRMGEVERNRCLCTEEVGGNYRRQWEDDEGEWEAKTLHVWVVVGEGRDMLTWQR